MFFTNEPEISLNVRQQKNIIVSITRDLFRRNKLSTSNTYDENISQVLTQLTRHFFDRHLRWMTSTTLMRIVFEVTRLDRDIFETVRRYMLSIVEEVLVLRFCANENARILETKRIVCKSDRCLEGDAVTNSFKDVAMAQLVLDIFNDLEETQFYWS